MLLDEQFHGSLWDGDVYKRQVQENTEAIHAHFLAQGIDTVFQLNPGNHFVQGIERTVAGIRWLLGR